eukprot:GEMP01049703.1.p1 GENE.GEMP01049703.1~~GEMP01049703.1.p1  ORF type:complete len:144 (-),score=8.05 GEMP01049703.1:1216-1647(-)
MYKGGREKKTHESRLREIKMARKKQPEFQGFLFVRAPPSFLKHIIKIWVGSFLSRTKKTLRFQGFGFLREIYFQGFLLAPPFIFARIKRYEVLHFGATKNPEISGEIFAPTLYIVSLVFFSQKIVGKKKKTSGLFFRARRSMG